MGSRYLVNNWIASAGPVYAFCAWAGVVFALGLPCLSCWCSGKIYRVILEEGYLAGENPRQDPKGVTRFPILRLEVEDLLMSNLGQHSVVPHSLARHQLKCNSWSLVQVPLSSKSSSASRFMHQHPSHSPLKQSFRHTHPLRPSHIDRLTCPASSPRCTTSLAISYLAQTSPDPSFPCDNFFPAR